MPLWLPDRMGEPAQDTSPKERFISTPSLVVARRAILAQLFKETEDLPPMSEAISVISHGVLPRKAGRVAVGSGIGSFDLQSTRVRSDRVLVAPQSKSALDEETKEPTKPGGVVFSQIHKTAKGIQISAKLYGIALNPDEEPWLADKLGINPRLGQNKYGIVITPVDPFVSCRFPLDHAPVDKDTLVLPLPRR